MQVTGFPKAKNGQKTADSELDPKNYFSKKPPTRAFSP
jgi:hypothetical protein